MNQTSKQKKATKWEPIIVTALRRKTRLQDLLTDDTSRMRLTFFLLYLIFFFISSVMSVVNVMTEWKLLTLSTVIFAAANLLNVLLCLLCRFTERISRLLLIVEIIALFTFFLIFGEPEGFSAIWVALLPACGLLLYGTIGGTLISVLQYLILLLLFWTEPGRAVLRFEYTQSFLLRFPLLYAAFYFVGLFFELLRASTQKELTRSRAQFDYLYRHDALTGIYNRYGFNKEMDALLPASRDTGMAFAILDLDHFKNINDKYGHQNGDVVLKQVAEDLSSQIGDDGIVCRWGGEEFAILFRTMEGSKEICDRILKYRRYTPILLSEDKFTVTLSIGLLEVSKDIRVTAANLVNLADANLYEAKNTGRDRIVGTRL